jgi:hypothetical protein
MAPTNFVTIVHPDIEGSASKVHPNAFRDTYEAKGWVLADADGQPRDAEAPAEISESAPVAEPGPEAPPDEAAPEGESEGESGDVEGSGSGDGRRRARRS